MEGLNKTQLILLALLVSFVTSIATGIVTVTLMDQAPAGVTQTINRIVERTVEKVVPSGNQSSIKTVVIKNEDFIVEAVKRNSGGVVKVSAFAQNDKGEVTKGEALGIGFAVSADGLIVLDSGIVSDDTSYAVTLSDGKTLKANTVSQDEKNGLAFVKAVPANDKEAVKLSPVELSDLSGDSALKLGQTVVALAGKDGSDVYSGIISGFRKSASLEEALLSFGAKVSETFASALTDASLQSAAVGSAMGQLAQNATSTEPVIKTIEFIKTSISFGKESSGSPLIDLNSKVVGMNLVRDGVSVAIPSTAIKEAMALAPQKKAE